MSLRPPGPPFYTRLFPLPSSPQPPTHSLLQGGGLQLRGPISGVFLFPTLVIFCEGAGIAAAKALIEAGTEPCGLGLKRRTDVRMYYRVGVPPQLPACCVPAVRAAVWPAGTATVCISCLLMCMCIVRLLMWPDAAGAARPAP